MEPAWLGRDLEEIAKRFLNASAAPKVGGHADGVAIPAAGGVPAQAQVNAVVDKWYARVVIDPYAKSGDARAATFIKETTAYLNHNEHGADVAKLRRSLRSTGQPRLIDDGSGGS